MKNTVLNRWPFFRTQSHRGQEPGATMFQGLRVRLTLWYCGVLGAALVLFCVILYIVARSVLLAPVQSGVIGEAHGHVDRWVRGSLDNACMSESMSIRSGAPPDDPQFHILACYDQNGVLLQSGNTAILPSAFLSNAVAKSALQKGEDADIINAGSDGAFYRYALAVPDATGKGYAGVVVVGSNIQTQTTLLSSLLIVLVVVGSVILFGAGFGGLFLASRALAPARLAFTRQQRFIADASHELRTPLTLMRADAEVLLRGREHMDVEDVFLLEDIVSEANHMSTLANSMLGLARLDAEDPHREHEILGLNALAIQGVHRVKALAGQKGVKVTHEDNGTPSVIGDPMLLEQAVLVLLDNAIKYNREGGQVTARTSIEAGQARLDVIDTGIGIATEHLPYLGERFYRVDKARSRAAGGTGLGLSIAQRIIALHSGTLTMSSIPNQGTTVTVLLPLAQNQQVKVQKKVSESIAEAPLQKQ